MESSDDHEDYEGGGVFGRLKSKAQGAASRVKGVAGKGIAGAKSIAGKAKGAAQQAASKAKGVAQQAAMTAALARMGMGSGFGAGGPGLMGGLMATFSRASPLMKTFMIIGLVLLAVVVLYFFGKLFTMIKNRIMGVFGGSDAEDVGGALSSRLILGFQNPPAAAGAATAEGFADVEAEAAAPEEQTLVNLQPLTIKQAGFLGPIPDGKFDPESAVGQALRAGFRSFVLQIDYLKTEKKGFAAPNHPTLVMKKEDGTMLATNSGSIEEVAKTIAALAFRPEVPNFTMPILLYLHINRTPSALKDPDGYLRFLSRIAIQLTPLAGFHLGMTPFGTFHRQRMEGELLTVPLSTLKGQVVILCNADTTPFRRQPAEGQPRINPKEDLDFWVNMRVYLDSEDDAFGVTRIPETEATPRAVIVDTERLLGLTAAKKEAFAIKGKSRFVIGWPPSAEKNMTPKEVATALNELGINMVPLDIFSSGDVEEAKALVEEYSNRSYRPKASILRRLTPIEEGK